MNTGMYHASRVQNSPGNLIGMAKSTIDETQQSSLSARNTRVEAIEVLSQPFWGISPMAFLQHDHVYLLIAQPMQENIPSSLTESTSIPIKDGHALSVCLSRRHHMGRGCRLLAHFMSSRWFGFHSTPQLAFIPGPSMSLDSIQSTSEASFLNKCSMFGLARFKNHFWPQTMYFRLKDSPATHGCSRTLTPIPTVDQEEKDDLHAGIPELGPGCRNKNQGSRDKRVQSAKPDGGNEVTNVQDGQKNRTAAAEGSAAGAGQQQRRDQQALEGCHVSHRLRQCSTA